MDVSLKAINVIITTKRGQPCLLMSMVWAHDKFDHDSFGFYSMESTFMNRIRSVCCVWSRGLQIVALDSVVSHRLILIFYVPSITCEQHT